MSLMQKIKGLGSQKGKIVFFCILFIAAFALVFCLVAGVNDTNYIINKRHKETIQKNFITKSLSKTKNAHSLQKVSSKAYIAVLYIQGVIEEKNTSYDQQWLLDTIQDLKEDKNNKAIMLYIDSPGGAVFQADSAYLALQDYKTTGKPISAYCAGLAASGGYYIACAADKIYANRNCLTGSIGVICSSFIDATGLLEKIGIKALTIHSGKNKNMGAINESATEEQKQIMQAISDECYEQFVDVVATARYMTLAQVKDLADGRVYTASQAKKLGLIDDIKNTLDLALEDMQKDIQQKDNLKKELQVIDYKPDDRASIYDYLMGAKTSIQDLLHIIKTGGLFTTGMQYLYK